MILRSCRTNAEDSIREDRGTTEKRITTEYHILVTVDSEGTIKAD